MSVGLLRLASLCLALVIGPAAVAPAQLSVAAASDLQTVLPEIAARFRQATGRQLRISYGSSGQFVSQIQNGAPFDLFLSADEEYVKRLVASGHADPATVVPYATGRLALWSRSDRGIDVTRGLTGLTDPRVRRLAIANPEHAPYGRAALEALRSAGVYGQLQGRLVFGENVSQAAHFAETGNADAAIIALSLTRAPAMQADGTAMEIPPTAYSPIRQTGVVVARAADKNAARRFLAFLTQPDIAALLRASGFGVQS
jgi:molybdate transport system substrate-binding protein